MSNELTLALPSNEFAVKVGTKVKMLTAETVMVLGGKTAQVMLAEAGFSTAYAKARNGNYRAAVEILSLGASAMQFKGMTPPEKDGKPGIWTKARVMLLAETILGRATPEKGWTKNALKGRTMARLIMDLDKAPPVTAQTPADRADDAQPADPLAGLEQPQGDAAPAPF